MTPPPDSIAQPETVDFDDWNTNVPAWRIPKLRTAIREAWSAGIAGEERPQDQHRALDCAWRRGQRWFRLVRPAEDGWTIRLALSAGRRWPPAAVPANRKAPSFLVEFARLWPRLERVLEGTGKRYHPSRHKKARLVAIACGMRVGRRGKRLRRS